MDDIFGALNTLKGFSSVEVTSTVIILISVISFVISLLRLYRALEKRIDEKIEAKMKPSVELLTDTVEVVKKLEKNTAEMNATLSILKDILLTHKFLDK